MDNFNITCAGQSAFRISQTCFEPALLRDYQPDTSVSHDKLTVFELVRLLQLGGWTVVATQKRKSLPPYVQNGDKCVYYHQRSAHGDLHHTYLICLLTADKLFERGARAIHHFALHKYYEALLQSKNPRAVLHAQPWAYYQLLLQKEKEGAQFGSNFDDEPGTLD